MTVSEAHGHDLTEVEARTAAGYEPVCVQDPEHVGDHWFPARDGSGRTLRCTQSGKLAIHSP